MRLPVEQDCKKHVGSNPTSPNIIYTGVMANIIPRETETFRKLRQSVVLGIFIGIVTCLVYATLFGLISSLGYWEYNCGSLLPASGKHDYRGVAKLFPENLLNQLRLIVFQIFMVRNLGFYILLGTLCGVCWRFLRQKDASIFMILPVIALFFVSTSFLLFENSFRALSGIWGFNN